jgi:hypothetical protein
VGHDGPIGNARVTAWARPFSWGLEAVAGIEQQRTFAREASRRAVPLSSARTDQDGRFVLAGLRDGALVSLWADGGARGQVVLEEVTVGAGGPLTLSLGEAYLLDGNTLVRGAPGYPYPHQQAGLTVLAVHTRLPLLLRGKTDAQGDFRLGHVPSGEYLVLGTGPGLAPEQRTVLVPPPPPPPPRATPPSSTDGGSVDDSLFGTQPLIPPPMLGLPDKAYAHGGLVLLSFVDTTSMAGVVTSGGKPVAGARVRLVADSQAVSSRTTDGAGRFHFTDVVLAGTSYAIEASQGARTVRDCVMLNVSVGGAWCCANSPTTGVADVRRGQQLSCSLRLPLDPGAAPASSEGEACPCDGSVLDALTPDAGS